MPQRVEVAYGGHIEIAGLSANALDDDLVSMEVSAFKTISLQLDGTWVGTLSFKGSNNGIVWYDTRLSDVAGVGSSISTTYNSIFSGPIRFKYLRVRMNPYSSGEATGTLILHALPASENGPTVVLGAGTNVIGNVAQSGTWTVQPGNTANTTPWLVIPNSQYPSGATPLQASSGNVANAQAQATLDVEASETAFITGFDVSGSGATAALPVTVTVTGLLGGTRSYTYSAQAGVLLQNTPLIVSFTPALQASATNTDIVVTCPALGAGNTKNVVNVQGYKK